MIKLSTVVYSVLIAAAAVAAPTANEDFVIAEDAQTFTNAVNAARAYTDAATNAIPAVDFSTSNATLVATIEATAPAPGNYAAVSNAAMNALQKSGSSASDLHVTDFDVENVTFGTAMNVAIDVSSKLGFWNPHDIAAKNVTLDLTRPPKDTSVAFLTDVPTNTSQLVNGAGFATFQEAKQYTDGVIGGLDTNWNVQVTQAIQANSAYTADHAHYLTDEGAIDNSRSAVQIFGQIDAAAQTNAAQTAAIAQLVPTNRTVNSKPLSSDVTLAASDVGAYSSAAGNTLAGQVATIGAHLNAEDARFVVTNYNSETHTPEAYVEIQLPDTSWSRIWSEMTRWNWLFDHYLPTNYYDKAAVNAALAEKADRAWGFYDSTTGEYAPDGYTWISSEKIAIAANLAYQRTVTSEGAIWVLESNGVVTETGGMTNGFFRISDDEGNSLFEIVKGNKRTVGADASSCQVVAGFTPTKLQIGYSIVSDVHPTLYVCQSLATQNWKAETDSDCIANVSWSGTSGAYVAQVQGKSAYSSMFVKATYEVGGETYISNAAPVSMQYIMIGGVKYAVGVGTVSGTTVLTLTVAP